MLLPVFVITVTVTLTLACQPDLIPDSVGFEATMYLADVVVAGHVAENGGKATGDVTFAVDCVYKTSNKSDVGTSITISGHYKTNSCTTTYLEQDQDYVLALNDVRDDSRYDVYEYNTGSTAAYPADRADFGKLVDLCGFENPKGLSAGACQVRQSGVECTTASVATSTHTTLWAAIILPTMLYLCY